MLVKFLKHAQFYYYNNKNWKTFFLDDCEGDTPRQYVKWKLIVKNKVKFPNLFLWVSHLGFPDDGCCRVDWIFTAPRWDMRGEDLGEGRGDTCGEEWGIFSGELRATGGGLSVGCFGMRLRRWLTQCFCSVWELVRRSSSLAVEMS